MRGMDYLLGLTILGIGIVAGLATLRDQMTQAFGDVASALEHLDQTYTVSITLADPDGGPPTIIEYGYPDTAPAAQTPGNPPGDMVIGVPPAGGED
jgi:hypothetical protein